MAGQTRYTCRPASISRSKKPYSAPRFLPVMHRVLTGLRPGGSSVSYTHLYRKLAAYGHMGREDLGVKWENTDRVEELKAAVAAL